ncbi:hypothetical protein SXANM310S_03793 [Streptomyces xanthochromogenes]
MPSNGSSPSTSIGPRHGAPYRLRRRSTMRRERAVRHPLPDRTATPPSWQSRTLRCATSRLDHGSCPWPAAPSGATLEVTLCGRSACTTPHTVRPTTDGPGPLSPDRLRTPGTPANKWQAPWHPQVTAFPPIPVGSPCESTLASSGTRQGDGFRAGGAAAVSREPTHAPRVHGHLPDAAPKERTSDVRDRISACSSLLGRCLGGLSQGGVDLTDCVSLQLAGQPFLDCRANVLGLDCVM